MSSVSAIPAPASLYREDQFFGWWTYAMMAGMVALASSFAADRPAAIAAGDGLRSSLAIAVGFGLPAIFLIGVLRMSVAVDASGVDIWFGWVPTYRRRIASASIVSLQVVSYRPLRDCGGWGIKTGRGGERVYSARGDRGVLLILEDGSRHLIGSQAPETLAAAIRQGLRPGV